MPAITSRQLAVEPRGRARASAPHRCEGGQPFQAATLYRRADRAWEVDAARRACLERFGVAAPENDEQREQIVIGLREEGHSPRAIAGALGLSAAQVRRDLAKLPKRAADEDSRRLERLRLHQARHTYAAFMIAAGVNAKALSTFMGHSSINVTFDLYGHLMPGRRPRRRRCLTSTLELRLRPASGKRVRPSPRFQVAFNFSLKIEGCVDNFMP